MSELIFSTSTFNRLEGLERVGGPPEVPASARDEELAAQVAQGDLTAFSLLYDRYAQQVYAWAAHACGPARAEDLVQEVFLCLWISARQFNERRGPFAAWFLAIARHAIGKELAKLSAEARLRAASEIADLIDDVADASIDVEDEVWRHEQGDILRQALQALPAEQRRVLVLAYFGGMSQTALAKSLGWPLGTVKKRVWLGLNKLRGLLRPSSAT
jgi:RNA polymerase sigma-70 factor (ECF subfamily)